MMPVSNKRYRKFEWITRYQDHVVNWYLIAIDHMNISIEEKSFARGWANRYRVVEREISKVGEPAIATDILDSVWYADDPVPLDR